MKLAKKLASLTLALVMILALSVPAFAAEGENTPAANGSITINSTATVSVAGRTFNAYKILDVKDYTPAANEGETGAVVYTVPEEMKSFYNTRYTLAGTEGDYDAQVAQKIAAETDMFAFAADALQAAKDAGVQPGTATAGADATSVTINSLPLGYYVVEDTGTEKPVSSLILDTTNLDPSVEIKADQPKLDKTIVESGEDVKNNNAAVGDTVNFKLTSKVPDMTGYSKYYFVVTDTLSKGLTYDETTGVTITFTKTADDGTVTTLKTLVKDTDFTVDCTKTEGADNTLKIVFKNFIQYNTEEYKDADITITYSATLNKYAEIGVTGNPNTATLKYSNNPNYDHANEPDGDEPDSTVPTGETEKSETRTYVTGVKLIKVDPKGNTLTGAQFMIEGEKLNTVLVTGEVFKEDADGTYWKLTDGTYTTDDPATEGMDQSKYESTTTKYAKVIETTEVTKTENVTYTGTVDENGVLTFKGLAQGTYTITELKSPAGYNLLKNPITVTIGFTAPEANATSADCTWAYSWKLGDEVMKDASGNEITVNEIQVVNQSGTELPSTGGIGTTIFYAVGGVLVLAAVVLLVVKKRMAR